MAANPQRRSGWRKTLPLLFISLCLWLGASCGARAEPPTKLVIPGGDRERGQHVLHEYGCIACHTIPGVRRGNATVGPPLNKWSTRKSIAGRFPNTPENLIAWIQDPQQMLPGSIMPDVGVPEPVARDMSAYLFTLQ